MGSRRSIALIITIGTVSLSACANQSNSGGSSTTGPIKIGMFATTSAATPSAFVNPFSVDGVQAAVKAVNDAGGVDGRKLELKVCDNGGDPNRAATCARQAASEKWVAVVGGFDPYGPTQTLPVLEAASIPYVGFLQGAPTEYQSAVSFPVEIGTVGGGVGTFKQMADDGCKAPVLIAAVDPGRDATVGVAKAAFQAKGVNVSDLSFTTGTPDATPTVADALSKKPDCVAFIGSGPDAAKIFGGIKKAGSKAALYAPPGVLLPQVVGAMGALAEGIKGASSAPLASDPSPEIQQVLKDLKAYKADAIPNEFAINGYAAVMLVRAVATGMGDVTGPALLKKLQSSKDVKVLNFPPLDFTAKRDSKLYPKVPNTSVYYSVVKGGQWTPVGSADATDVADLLP